MVNILLGIVNKLSIILLALLVFGLTGCGDGTDTALPSDRQEFEKLSHAEKDYVERFNVAAKDIRDFPPKGKDIEKYFHIIKSVTNIDDAKILLFAETHDHAGNQLWSAGVINRMVKPKDVVLFEGAPAGTPVGDVSERISTRVFVAREYEKLKVHKTYKATAHSKIESAYLSLFLKTKKFLALNLLNFSQVKGYFWDLLDGTALHSDSAKRNAAMVDTIKNNLQTDNKVVVIAGALHFPHFQFAWALAEEHKADPGLIAYQLSGAKIDELNEDFYDYFAGSPNDVTTRVVYDYLKDKDYAIFIPKNSPRFETLKPYFPKSLK